MSGERVIFAVRDDGLRFEVPSDVYHSEAVWPPDMASEAGQALSEWLRSKVGRVMLEPGPDGKARLPVSLIRVGPMAAERWRRAELRADALRMLGDLDELEIQYLDTRNKRDGLK